MIVRPYVKKGAAKLADILIGLVILLCFQFAGQSITDQFSLTLPGPVIGMLLLFVALTVVKKAPRALSDTSAMLIKHLSLFFLPAATGIFFLGAAVNRELPAITLIMVVSTVVAMMITAFLMQWLIRKKPIDERDEEMAN
ncbi:MAG: CidA/LrgA family protein [Pseudomonadales bacterium]|nr:CidA/LrgA family protein [Pseudomonadales bacterium]